MTKYKDLQPSQIKESPFTNIGAQDLCSIESNWQGLIRKEGALERSLHRFGSLCCRITSVHWRQYFVVLSQGCVYVFHDEFAASPKIYFSLKNCGRIKEHVDSVTPDVSNEILREFTNSKGQRVFEISALIDKKFLKYPLFDISERNYITTDAFDILPISEQGKVYRFSCATDKQRLDWMRALYVSLLTVYNRPLPSTEQSNRKEEYTLLESDIVTSPSSLSKKIYEIDDESSGDNDHYDQPDEIEMSPATKHKYAKDPTYPKKLSKTRTKSDSSTDSTGRSADVPKLGNAPEDESSIFEDNDNNEEYSVDAASLPHKKPKTAPKPTKKISALQDMGSKTNPRCANTLSETSEKPKTNPKNASSPPETSKKPGSAGEYKTMKSSDQGRQFKSIGPGVAPKPLKSPGHDKTEQSDWYINTKDITQTYVELDPGADHSSEYLFDGNRENAARVLDIEPVRTFLIRNATEAGKKVLVVKSGVGLKSYKIDKQGPKLLIDSGATFDTIQQLVDYYKKNKLPNIGVTLKRGFKSKKVQNTGDDSDYEPVEEPVKPPK